MSARGRIIVHDGEIGVLVPAQVAIKLDRLYKGVRRFGKEFRFAARPEAAYDLEWFRQRYPMDFEPGSEEPFMALVARHEERLALVAEVDSGDYVPPQFDLAIPPREYQREGADLAIRSQRLLIADVIGSGKLQPVDTDVLTPNGWRKIGDLVVGDEVIGSNGRATAVTGVFPQGVKPSYRVSFFDGSNVEAGADHLWSVDYLCGGRRWQRITVTTEQLRTRPRIATNYPGYGRATSLDLAKTKLRVPMLSAPVEFTPGAPLPVPPYTLGIMIANGSLAHGTPTISNHAGDWPEVRARIIAEGVALGSESTYGNVIRTCVLDHVGAIRDLGLDVLSGAKRIPRAYLRATPRERLALLHGLMDGDGHVSKTRNRVSYSTTSVGLDDDVVELVEQLGGSARAFRMPRERAYKGVTTKYVECRVRVRLPSGVPPVLVRRKADRYRPVWRDEPARTVESVEYVRDVESVCIAVAAPDRLYATEHAILTHNTITGICVLAGPGALPALVVTETHLTRQWIAELARFAPKLRVSEAKTTTPHSFGGVEVVKNEVGKRIVVRGPAMPDVIVMSYSKMAGWGDHLAGKVKTVLFDEAQALRRPDSKRRDGAVLVAREAKIRVALSASPVMNYGEEIHSVISVLDEEALGGRSEFIGEWCSGPKNAVTDPRALGVYLREIGLMIRRTRADIGREVPDLTIVRHVVDANMKYIEEEASNVAELARRILARTGSALQQMNDARDIDWRMRQATGLSKAHAVIELVRLLVESGERVILAGWHRSVYALWAGELKKHEVTHAWFTGEESASQKAASVAAFKAGTASVLIMSLRSGAGLDGLQHVCRTVVIGELDWSPEVHRQLIGRAQRDGQEEKVTAYYCVAEDGSDPVIEDVLGIKEAQASGISEPESDAPIPIPDPAANEGRIRKLAEDVLKRKREGAQMRSV